jgi:uncharacterized protein (DUF2235 family)
MKRLVVLIDGTWNDEHQGDLTNVAKLDPRKNPIIKPRGSNGTEQIVFYHSGVGTGGGLLERILRRGDRPRAQAHRARGLYLLGGQIRCQR